MGSSFLILNNPRRRRLIAFALILTTFTLYFGFRSQFSFPAEILASRPPGAETQAEVVDVVGGQPSLAGQKPSATGDPVAVFPKPEVVSGASTVPNGGAHPGADGDKGPAVKQCPGFEAYMLTKPGPASEGKRQFPYVRPTPECRTFNLPAMEALIERMRTVIKDPDLFRLFENSYPNTLDTMIKWRGYANATDPATGVSAPTNEELTYVITGDIDAMWLRDSASQILSYLPLLEPSADPDSLAALWRGVVNTHSRYVLTSPYCHAFQPPAESGIPPTRNGAYSRNHPKPAYDPLTVFDCKWELDSLASFLQLSTAYLKRTGDVGFFKRPGSAWPAAVRAAVDAAAAMRKGTYDTDGRVLPSAWTFTGWTDRGSETLTNNGLGNPTKENGMVRAAFRPSDDATIFQLLTPANLMFARYLDEAAGIADELPPAKADGNGNGNEDGPRLATDMRDLAAGIRAGVERDAIVKHPKHGDIFAYEIDGFGGANLMDDANVPSLLAMPLWNLSFFTIASAGSASLDELKKGRNKADGSGPLDYLRVYRNTRAFALSADNPYFSRGPVLSAVGGPHLGPGKGWPMAAIVAALTALEDGVVVDREKRAKEVVAQITMVMDSTTGTGVVHESVNAWDVGDWSRPWFGWANGLFGELILRIAQEEEQGRISAKDSLLGRSWQ